MADRNPIACLVAAAALAVAPGGCTDDEPNFAGKRLPAGGAPSTPAAFKKSSERGWFYFNEPYGQRREVHFIASGPYRTHPRQTHLCVEHYLDEDVAAPFCYAYASEKAFRSSKFKPSNGQTGPFCWSARSQKPAGYDVIIDNLADPDAAGNEGCPDLPPG